LAFLRVDMHHFPKSKMANATVYYGEKTSPHLTNCYRYFNRICGRVTS